MLNKFICNNFWINSAINLTAFALSVRLSLCPSVTFRYSMETV